jgi:dihydrofolate synthase / folylpolyglutamate synthase
MTYQETITHIFNRGRFGIKPGLERIRVLLDRLDNPHRTLRAVQIAGTNGKGSTAAFLASIATAAGYTTGLYTSPHLVSFTERFRINGQEISEEQVVALASRVLSAAPGDATFFELVTAMAFLWFATEQVDLAVIETGLGGRYDATNVLDGMLAIITPLGLDHCAYLGDSLAAIAGEKAGIIKPGRPVVMAPQEREAQAVIVRQCERAHSPLYCFGERYSAAWESDGLCYRGLTGTLAGLRPGIAGRYQSVNAAVALAAAELLAAEGLVLPVAARRAGVERACWPGRMESFPGPPRILLDGAHNEAGAHALADSLADYPRTGLILVVGVMADKEWPALLTPLLPLTRQVVAVTPAPERALPAVELAAFCHCLGIAVEMAPSVAAGLDRARELAASEELVLVTGSLFTVGEARAHLTGGSFQAIRG